MPHVTPELVAKAYDALASGDMAEIEKYWDKDMNWLVPGHNRLSGWYHGRDEFLAFMGEVGRLSNNSFHMERTAVMVSDEYSADVTYNEGYRAGFEDKGTHGFRRFFITYARADGASPDVLESITNRLYFLERSEKLATWVEVAQGMQGSGERLSLVDTNPPSESAFYRVSCRRIPPAP